MQNKANLRNYKTNITTFLTMRYVNLDTWRSGKTNPIQSQFKPNKAKNKPNSKPNKPKQTQLFVFSKLEPAKAGLVHRALLQDEAQILLKFINSCYTKTPSKTDGNEVDIYMLLCHYIRYLIWLLASEVVRRLKLRFIITNNTETSSN